MPSVIDEDIQLWQLFFDMSPKHRIRLISDEYFSTVIPIGLAGRFNVDAINTASGPEIILPHPETSSAVDTDLHDMDFFADKLAEVSVINLKVVHPLPDPGTLPV
jgi:hypothetical protein